MIAELAAVGSADPPPGALPKSAKRRRTPNLSTWTVLAIEDDPDDVVLIGSTLRDARRVSTGAFDLVSRGSLAAGLEHLRSARVDVLLLDLVLPDAVGLEGLAQIRQTWPDIPIVVLTGQDDDLLALRALREGAQDYIPKLLAFSMLLTRSLRYAIERKLAERERISSEARYRQLLETVNEGVATFDVGGSIEWVNPRTIEMLEPGAGDLIGKRMEEFVVPLQRSSFTAMLLRCTSGKRDAHEFIFRRSDAVELSVKVSGSPLRDPHDNIVGVVALFTDLTERRKSARILREREEELREAHKLEAVGRLAGGVAHDFNNMLTVIGSYTELVLATPALDKAIAADLAEVAAAADRAAGLTRQLMSFTRKQLAEYEAVDLPSLLAGMSGLLRPLTGEHISLSFDISAPVPPILGDARQLEQVVVNLVCNARDAMPAGGAIAVTISRLLVAAGDSASKLPEGEFVLLKVTDTGCGMEPEIVAKIFEPFFTTKPVGRGTGLGLATVYGIVHQAGGHIWCESEVGKGSSFSLAFPARSDALAARASRRPVAGTTGAENERILLVEDDAAVRAVTARILASNGYVVLPACNGMEALKILEQAHGAVDLVITDLVMPEMSGPDFVAAACLAYPQLRFAYMSGYSSQDTWKKALSDQHAAFLEKPFSSEHLLSTVRTVLASAPDGK